MNDVIWCKNAYGTMEGAAALTIITELNQFRALDFTRDKSLLSAPILAHFRNIYDPAEIDEQGFQFFCVGRKPMTGTLKNAI